MDTFYVVTTKHNETLCIFHGIASGNLYHTEVKTKMAPIFADDIFRLIFLNENCILALIRRQAIIWTNDVSLSLNELTNETNSQADHSEEMVFLKRFHYTE